MKRAAYLLSAGLLLTGCSSVSNQYASLEETNTTSSPRVVVHVSSQNGPADAAKPALVTTLSDHAQAELAKLGAAQSGATIETVAQALTKVAAASAKTKDNTKLTKQIIATIDYAGRMLPDDSRDRIECAVLTIRPENAVFESWDQVKTSYATVSLGSVGSEQDFTLSGEIDPKVGGSLSAAKITPSFTAKNTASRDLSDRVVALSGQLTAHRAVIFQQGAPTQDLVGNTVLNLVLDRTKLEVVSVFSTGDLIKDNLDVKPSDVSLTTVLTTTSAEPVTATIEMTYVVRHVVEGSKSLQEDDDKAAYVQGSTATSRLEIDHGQPLFELRTRSGAINAWPLDAAGKAQSFTSKRLLFSSVGDAQAFFNWLQRQNNAILKNFALYSNVGQPLAPSDVVEIHQLDQPADFGPAVKLPIYESHAAQDDATPTSCQAKLKLPDLPSLIAIPPPQAAPAAKAPPAS